MGRLTSLSPAFGHAQEQITQFSLYYMSLPPNLPFSRIIDEIYNGVDHVEPWMSGNVRGASTAFCLLHRLFEASGAPWAAM